MQPAYIDMGGQVGKTACGGCGACGVCGACGACGLCGPTPILGALLAAESALIGAVLLVLAVSESPEPGSGGN